eukprot:476108_1
MSCNSFSFIPYTNTLHFWKYDKAKYYQHVLSSLFTASPNETATNARIILQSRIDKYIQQVKQDTSLPEWSDAYFAVLCTQIKQNTRHEDALVHCRDMKQFVLDYHQLKVIKASDFEHKKAFTELSIGSLKTLNKYLSIIHCMQRKGLTFTQ